jgi:hypothetical protein
MLTANPTFWVIRVRLSTSWGSRPEQASPARKESAPRRGLGLLRSAAVLATRLAVADEGPHRSAEGTKARVCDELGFMSFVWGVDEELQRWFRKSEQPG